MAKIFLTASGTFDPSTVAGWPGKADKVECLGSGGGGSARQSTSRGGNGGGGGEYAAELSVAITSSKSYTVGTAGGTTDTSFPGDSVTIAAHHGVTGTTSTGGTGGTGSTNTTHFNGGAGRTTPTSTASGGGGGGAGGPSGAGSTAASNVGGAADNSTVSAPAAGNNGLSGTEFDGSHGCGTGASGFASGTNNGTTGGTYGGGGSGASDGGAGSTGGTGSAGLIIITYTPHLQTVSLTQTQHASLVATGTLAVQGDPQAISIQRGATHATALAHTGALSMTAQVSRARTYTATSPEALTKVAQASRALSLAALGQSSSMQKMLTRPASVLSSPESFSIPRSMTHNVAPSTPGLVTAGKAVARTVLASDGQNLTAQKTIPRSMLLSLAESLVRQLTAFKALTLTDAESLLARVTYPRTVAPLSPSTLSLSERKLIGRIVSIAEGEIVTAAKQTAKGVSFADSEVLNKSVTAQWSRSLAAGSHLGFTRVPGRLAAFADPATVSGTQKLVIGRSASVSQAEIIMVSEPATRPYGANISAAIPISIVRQVSHTTIIAASAMVSVTKLASRVIAASLAALVTLAKSSAHIASVVSTGTLVAGRGVRHGQSLSQSQTVLNGRAIAKNVISAQPEGLTVTRASTFGLLQNFSQTSLLGVAKNINPALIFATGATVLIIRRFTRRVAPIIGIAVAVTKLAARAVSFASANNAVVGAKKLKVIAVSAVSSALISVGRMVGTTLNPAQAGIVAIALRRTLNRTLLSAQVLVAQRAVATAIKMMFSPQLATLIAMRVLSRSLTLTQGALLRITLSTGKSVQSLANQIFAVSRRLPFHANFAQTARVITQAVGTIASRGSTQLLTMFAAKIGTTPQPVGLFQTEAVATQGQAARLRTILLPADPVIAFSPPVPSIPNTTPLGAQVAQIIITMTDGSLFAGQLSFGLPFQNDGGIYAIDNSVAPVTYTGNNFITINPSGPGVGAEGGNIDNITVVAKVVPTRMFNMVSSTQQKFVSAHPKLLLLSSPQSIAMLRFIAKTIAALSPQSLTAQKTAAHFRTLAMSHAQIAVAARSAIKNLPAIALGQVMTISSRTGKIILALNSALLSLNKQRFRTAVFSVFQALTERGQRTTNMQSVGITSGQSSSLAHQPQKLILSTLVSQISKLVAIARAVALAMPELLIAGRLSLLTLAFSHAQSAAALRQAAHQRTIAMVGQLLQTLKQVHIFYLNVAHTLVQANVNRVGKLIRVFAPNILKRTSGRFRAIAAAIAQSMSVATVKLRHLDARVIAQTQLVANLASAVRSWPRVIDPNAMISSAQRLVVGLASTIAPVFPTSAVLRFGRALRPLYARRRFIKR